MEDEVPWEGRALTAADAFAEQCYILKETCPYSVADLDSTALENVVSTFMTELWDRDFSQSEIRSAFERALMSMPHYAAGLEKRTDGSL